jgi:hypothetical protein
MLSSTKRLDVDQSLACHVCHIEDDDDVEKTPVFVSYPPTKKSLQCSHNRGAEDAFCGERYRTRKKGAGRDERKIYLAEVDEEGNTSLIKEQINQL